MNHATKTLSVLAIAVLMVGGCSTAPSTSDGRSELLTEARNTIE